MLPHEIVIELRTDLAFVLQNTIHWIKSISRIRRSDATGDVQALVAMDISNPSAQNDFLMIATNTFSISQRPVESKLIGSRSESRIRTKATLRAGGTRMEAIYDAEAIRGSFLTERFRAGQRATASRDVSGQLAEWCIKLHGPSRVQTMLDPFLGIGNSASLRSAVV